MSRLSGMRTLLTTPPAASVLVRLAALALAAAALAMAFAGMSGPIGAVEVIGMAAFAVALVPGVELASFAGVLCVVIGAVVNDRSALAAAAVGLLLLAWALSCDLAESLALQPMGRRAGPRIRRWAVQAAGVLVAGVAGAVLSVAAASVDLVVGRTVGVVLAVMAPVLAFGALALAWQYRATPAAEEPQTAERMY
jgi:hypothetical protein